IVKDAVPLPGHLQAHDALTTLGLEAGAGRGGLGHPAAAVAVGLLRLVCSLPLYPQLVHGRVVPIGQALLDPRADSGLVARQFLRLVIRSVRPSDLCAFVPVQAHPAEAVQDGPQRLGDVALLVSVVNTQDKLAAMAAGKEPVKQGGAYTANVQIPSRTRG